MNKYTLEIDGMMCSMCESHVNDIIRKNFNTIKVKSSHLKKEAIFTTNDKLTNEDIINAFLPTGYKVLDIKLEENVKKKLFGI